LEKEKGNRGKMEESNEKDSKIIRKREIVIG
jgi:hypothetical protein